MVLDIAMLINCFFFNSDLHKIIIIILFFSFFFFFFTPLEFFTSVLTDGFTLEFEWQQVSSSLLDSSQDSGHS